MILKNFHLYHSWNLQCFLLLLLYLLVVFGVDNIVGKTFSLKFIYICVLTVLCFFLLFSRVCSVKQQKSHKFQHLSAILSIPSISVLHAGSFFVVAFVTVCARFSSPPPFHVCNPNRVILGILFYYRIFSE